MEFTIGGLAGRTDPLSIKLDRHVNVFFGLNGSGKTSLLKILHSAMSRDVMPLLKVPFTEAKVAIYSLDYKKVFNVTCQKPPTSVESTIDETEEIGTHTESAQEEYTTNAEPDFEWTVEPPLPRSVVGRWSHGYLPTARLYLSDRISYEDATRRGFASLELSEERLEQSFAEQVNKVWTRYSANVLGEIQKAQAAGLADILNAILSGESGRERTEQLDPQTAYERVSKFLERQGSKSVLSSAETFKRHYSMNAQLRSVVSDIDKVESKIQESVAPRDKLQSLISQMFSGNKKVVFTNNSIEIIGSGNTKIGLVGLSSGEKQLLRILIGCLMAGESSLLIDEPEISLHVDWQRSLIAVMRQLNPDAQLIIATHSPEIMAEIEDKNIFRL